MPVQRFVIAILLVAAAGCASNNEAAVSCDGFSPDRPDVLDCGDVALDTPTELAACGQGAGYAGQWGADEDGLPAYLLTVEQRCDAVGQHGSVEGRGPVHLIGNGRGTIGIAHASGAVEMFSMDRGHKYLNRVENWDDPSDPDFPRQLGGGYSYLVKGDKVWSTRHDDLPISSTTERQSRKLGVGYFETQTVVDGNILVRRKIFAPEEDSRVLVAEVSVSNLSGKRQELGLVEFWDINLHDLSEVLDSDTVSPDDIEGIVRSRRQTAAAFGHEVEYDVDSRLITVQTSGGAVPDNVAESADPSRIDYFVDPIYLAVIDQGPVPDAVWLTDDEIWGEGEVGRGIPGQVGEDGDPSSRGLSIGGAGQPVALAMRLPVTLPPASTVTRRFAFGLAIDGTDPVVITESLRARSSELRPTTVERWKERLVWSAFPGFESAGAMQRELAWSSYYLVAGAGFDVQSDTRVVSQGGAYRYFYGMEPLGDIALFADALNLVDPLLARDSLEYALSKQHFSQSQTPYRLPYGGAGIDVSSDAGGLNLRTDGYFLLPAAVARYIAANRDPEFLQKQIHYLPRRLKELGSVSDHLTQLINFAGSSIGLGARGLLAMGTGDVTDGITDVSSSAATPAGSSSTVTAALIGAGFPLAIDLFDLYDKALSGLLTSVFDGQVSAFIAEAWAGDQYSRGFADNGSPMAGDHMFVAPQALAIVGNFTDGARRLALLDRIDSQLDTIIGPVAGASTSGSSPADGTVLVNHTRPGINGWATEAYARAEWQRGWDSLVRNSMSRHAEIFPGTWYGIWTGPDSYVTPDDPTRPGQVGIGPGTAFGQSPGLNLHGAAASLRGLMALAGVSVTPRGLRVEPRVPTETYHVVWPYFSVRVTPDTISGTATTIGTESLELELVLPSGLKTAALMVLVNGVGVGDYTVDGDEITLQLPLIPGDVVRWSVIKAPTN